MNFKHHQDRDAAGRRGGVITRGVVTRSVMMRGVSGLMSMWMKIVVLLGAAFALGGCLPSQTIVLEPLVPTGEYATISIRQACSDGPEASSAASKPASEVKVESEQAQAFASVLHKEIIRRTRLHVVSSAHAPLTLEYRFALHDRGDAGVRVLAGAVSLLGSPFYGLGDGNVAVEVTYFDEQGTVRGKVIKSVPLSGAFGSSEESFRTAAEEIAEITKVNFDYQPPAEPHSILKPAPSTLGVPPY